MIEKIVQRASLGLIAIAGGLLIWFFWTIFAPIKVIDVVTQPAEISATTIKAGDSIFYTVDYCKYLPIKAEVIRQLVNSTTIPLEEYDSNAEAGGCHYGVKAKPSIIPSYVGPGEYHLQIHYLYRPYPWRTIDYSFDTEFFKVVE